MHKTLSVVPAGLFAIMPAGASPPPGSGSNVAPASAVVSAPGRSPTAPARTQEKAEQGKQSLYERLGGIFAISGVVDRFSDAIIANPKLNRNPALVAWNQNESASRLPGLKVMRTVWIAALTGGPFEYGGMPLDDAHGRFRLTEEEFDEVGAEIVRALDFYKVPEREKQELVGAYMKSKPQVVAASR
jgi:hemoglobin